MKSNPDWSIEEHPAYADLLMDIEADRINASSRAVKAGNYTSGEELDRILGT